MIQFISAHRKKYGCCWMDLIQGYCVLIQFSFSSPHNKKKRKYYFLPEQLKIWNKSKYLETQN